jgi:hypothetical protein
MDLVPLYKAGKELATEISVLLLGFHLKIIKRKKYFRGGT